VLLTNCSTKCFLLIKKKKNLFGEMSPETSSLNNTMIDGYKICGNFENVELIRLLGEVKDIKYRCRSFFNI
jgi:hypothetical protein